MPVKKTKAKPRRGQITEADAAAFIAGEGLALHRALGLKPWQFTTSPTAQRAADAAEIMRDREKIEAELMSYRDVFAPREARNF